MTRVAVILLASVVFWIVAIAIIVMKGNAFPPRACSNLILLSECILDIRLRFGAELAVAFILSSFGCWATIRKRVENPE